jgi:hypothetical protein
LRRAISDRIAADCRPCYSGPASMPAQIVATWFLRASSCTCLPRTTPLSIPYGAIMRNSSLAAESSWGAGRPIDGSRKRRKFESHPVRGQETSNMFTDLKPPLRVSGRTPQPAPPLPHPRLSVSMPRRALTFRPPSNGVVRRGTRS